MVGGVRADIGDVKYFGSSGSTYILVVDVGFVPMYWKDVGRVPPSGGTDTDEQDDAEEPVRYMDVPFPGGGD